MKITVKEFVKLDIQGLMQINGGTSACGNYTQTQPATPPSGGNETNNAPSNNGGNTGGSGSDTPSSYSPSYSGGSTTGTSTGTCGGTKTPENPPATGDNPAKDDLGGGNNISPDTGTKVSTGGCSSLNGGNGNGDKLKGKEEDDLPANDLPENTTPAPEQPVNPATPAEPSTPPEQPTSPNSPTTNSNDGSTGGDDSPDELNGSLDGFLENINSLVGGYYVYGGNDPESNGGVDCSGAILWAINQEGNNIPDQTADDIYNNTELIEYVSPDDIRPGDLRFLLDENGDISHVQVILDTSGSRFNASGGPENTIDNPGTLEILTSSLPATGVYGRLNFGN